MRCEISKAWMLGVKEEIRRLPLEGGKIEHVTSFGKAAAWMVTQFVKNDIVFKVQNMGVGVKKITTDVENCPMCGHFLKERGKGDQNENNIN